MNIVKKERRLLRDINAAFNQAFLKWSPDMSCIEIHHETARRLSKRIELLFNEVEALKP